jgi:hypothetical protein
MYRSLTQPVLPCQVTLIHFVRPTATRRPEVRTYFPLAGILPTIECFEPGLLRMFKESELLTPFIL